MFPSSPASDPPVHTLASEACLVFPGVGLQLLNAASEWAASHIMVSVQVHPNKYMMYWEKAAARWEYVDMRPVWRKKLVPLSSSTS